MKNVWVEIKDFDVNIHETDEGIVVDIWGKDKSEPVASTYAFDAENIDFSNFCPKCNQHWAVHNGDGSCVEDKCITE